MDGFQQMISGKYKLRILWNLKDGQRRYSEIKSSLGDTKSIKNIASRVLSRELKALANLGLIDRKDFESASPRVEYSLTSLGTSLLPAISIMHAWGVQHLVKKSALERYAALQICASESRKGDQ